MPQFVLTDDASKHPNEFAVECFFDGSVPMARTHVFDKACLMPAPLEFALKVVRNAAHPDGYRRPIFVKMPPGFPWPEDAGPLWRRLP